MSDDFARDVAIFTEALRLPAAERPAFLELACAGDEERRHKIEDLLSTHDRAAGFLETPACEAWPEAGADAEMTDNEAENPGKDNGDNCSQ